MATRLVRVVVRLLGITMLLVGVATITSAAGSQAAAKAAVADDPPLLLTIAARTCPTYGSIMANRARNNIQESLRDLGKDTVYTGGQPIDPALEQANNPRCQPLRGWSFQFGDNYESGKVDRLSVVQNPARITDPTGTVPLLDDQGQPTGQTLDGAVTVQLSPAEQQLALGANLWIQGGTVDDPLLYNSFNSSRIFGFGALRCAIDNLNGDNVEFVAYPGGAKHVFCYYYTVEPAPTAGTIVVRKELAGGGSDTHTFNFNGNISYVPDGSFQVDVNNGQPGSASFDRAAGSTWNFQELDDPLYVPTGPPTCVSQTGGSSATITGQRVAVKLGAEDVMTCTYTNQRNLTGLLQLFKQTLGGIGTFGFTVDRPDGTVGTYTTSTDVQGEPVLVASNPGGPVGEWTATETLPTDPGGTWALTGATCNGEPVPVTGTSATITVALGEPVNCVATNTFSPAGAITIDKTTIGGTGTFGFVVRDESPGAAPPRAPLVQVARTTAENVPVRAIGSDLTGLDVYTPNPDGGQTPLRAYSISELLPPVPGNTGRWRLRSADCGPNTAATSLGVGVVRLFLAPDTPVASCSFVNELIPFPTLSVTKRILGDAAGRAGDVVLTVHCEGPDGTEPFDQTITGPASEPGPFTLAGQPVPFSEFPQTCTVEETRTGAAAGATVDTAVTVQRGSDPPEPIDGSSATVVLDQGDQVAVVVTDTYAAAPTPTPTTTTPVPTSPTPTSPEPTTPPGTLPVTGANGPAPLAFVGAGLIALGATLLLLSTRRRRPAH